jgi:hypothetical protein
MPLEADLEGGFFAVFLVLVFLVAVFLVLVFRVAML